MSERTAPPGHDTARRTSGGEPAKRSLTERLQDTLSNAAEEHRANAGPASSRGSRVRRTPGRQPRRARLRLTRVDPWSEEQTSELQSRGDIVCRRPPGKKKSTRLNSSHVEISYAVFC